MTVFLNIDWSEPGTLLYHLAEPRAETIAHPAYSGSTCSAVGQYILPKIGILASYRAYMAFSLMTLDSSVHRQEERQRARGTCPSGGCHPARSAFEIVQPDIVSGAAARQGTDGRSRPRCDPGPIDNTTQHGDRGGSGGDKNPT
ncbi:hypothetical protein G6O67_001449 [Ophiocordyceps sinensis]|uniref:Uncharacterized protein n=1 Tax=Ophiocordyceps sinensis TaxID=72228 RepID=A0A8H4V942_9HYPO|nr:hypothetical protein G6O67_001449 [Ophiocordyceps sinensis]